MGLHNLLLPLGGHSTAITVGDCARPPGAAATNLSAFEDASEQCACSLSCFNVSARLMPFTHLSHGTTDPWHHSANQRTLAAKREAEAVLVVVVVVVVVVVAAVVVAVVVVVGFSLQEGPKQGTPSFLNP